MSSPAHRMVAAIIAATALAVTGTSADATAAALSDSPRWLVEWRVGGAGSGGAEQFRCILTRFGDAARVSEAIARRTSAGIPLGRVRFFPAENHGHFWHMENVHLVDITVEIYDGRPSDIDRDIVGWMTTVKRYGPWSARPVKIMRIG